jgi:hypothetical protein
MLSISVEDDVYGLGDSSSSELLRRLEEASPPPEGEIDTTLEKLRAALDSEQAARLDDGDLALIGVVLEAWAVEEDGDLPGDVEELRYAIAARLG